MITCPVFVLTHRPPDPPDPEVTYLSGDVAEAVATARRAAGGKNLEILGSEVRILSASPRFRHGAAIASWRGPARSG